MNFRWRTCKNIVRVSRASLKPDPWHCHRHQHQHHQHHQFTFPTRATCAFPFYVFWSFIKRQVRRLGRYYYVPDSDPDKCTLNRFWSIGKWLLFYRFIHSLQNLSRPPHPPLYTVIINQSIESLWFELAACMSFLFCCCCFSSIRYIINPIISMAVWSAAPPPPSMDSPGGGSYFSVPI